MTGVWWIDIVIAIALLYVVLYVKAYDNRSSTKEKAEVEELERMWKL